MNKPIDEIIVLLWGILFVLCIAFAVYTESTAMTILAISIVIVFFIKAAKAMFSVEIKHNTNGEDFTVVEQGDYFIAVRCNRIQNKTVKYPEVIGFQEKTWVFHRLSHNKRNVAIYKLKE